MQRERLKLVSNFHPLPLQIYLVTEPSARGPPVWGLQGGRSHAGCGSQQRLQRESVSLWNALPRPCS